MTGRLTLAAAAAAAVLGAAPTAANTPAHSAIGALPKCGTVTAGGKVWQVGAAGLSCASARSIVKKLGAKPTPPARRPYYRGLYLGMRCLGAKTKSGKHAIDCGGAGGKALAAIANR